MFLIDKLKKKKVATRIDFLLHINSLSRPINNVRAGMWDVSTEILPSHYITFSLFGYKANKSNEKEW